MCTILRLSASNAAQDNLFNRVPMHCWVVAQGWFSEQDLEAVRHACALPDDQVASLRLSFFEQPVSQPACRDACAALSPGLPPSWGGVTAAAGVACSASAVAAHQQAPQLLPSGRLCISALAIHRPQCPVHRQFVYHIPRDLCICLPCRCCPSLQITMTGHITATCRGRFFASWNGRKKNRNCG